VRARKVRSRKEEEGGGEQRGHVGKRERRRRRRRTENGERRTENEERRIQRACIAVPNNRLIASLLRWSGIEKYHGEEGRKKGGRKEARASAHEHGRREAKKMTEKVSMCQGCTACACRHSHDVVL
jgi:hypothetical protein